MAWGMEEELNPELHRVVLATNPEEGSHQHRRAPELEVLIRGH